ncbi:hypothetical protein [Shewanella algae]|jgi:hypothetical protein|uniref:hypothetical protein n=1 Tax=Shewanella algae TaxID=38313 RepID=UPI00313C3FCC
MPFIPLQPIPMKDRVSMIFLQYGQIDVIDGAFVLVDKNGIRTHIPVANPEERVPISCFIRPNWPWMKSYV